MPRTLRLYGYPISHYCVAVDRMAAFKGLRVRSVYVPYHDKRALLRATGQDFVPALVDGRKVVTWRKIPDYLERLEPEPTLFPPGKAGLARTLEDWGHQVLEERVWRSVVTRVPATFTDDVERWVFEELQTRSRGPFADLRAREPEFRTERDTYLALVESMLDGHPWLLDEPSVADFGVFGALAPLAEVGEPIPARFPNLRRWSEGIRRLRA
ncbi:MAG TPA: glutathione S-transferase family protein [Thermoplasmata archaeon]|nr:glutathione S-transferase family protein [Thermoplasmata archaeon]